MSSGIARRQVCADLGVSRSSLQKWINEARLDAYGMSPSAGVQVHEGTKCRVASDP